MRKLRLCECAVPQETKLVMWLSRDPQPESSVVTMGNQSLFQTRNPAPWDLNWFKARSVKSSQFAPQRGCVSAADRGTPGDRRQSSGLCHFSSSFHSRILAIIIIVVVINNDNEINYANVGNGFSPKMQAVMW